MTPGQKSHGSHLPARYVSVAIDDQLIGKPKATWDQQEKFPAESSQNANSQDQEQLNKQLLF